MNFREVRTKRQKGKYSLFHSLHLKITAGYVFIVGILITIVFIVRCETNKLGVPNRHLCMNS